MLGFANLKEVWDVPKRRKEEILNMVSSSSNEDEKKSTGYKMRQTPPLKIRDEPHIEPVFESMEPGVPPNIEETPPVVDKEELVIRITNPLIINALRIYNDSYKEELIMGIIEKALVGVNNVSETFITGRSDVDIFFYIFSGILTLVFANWVKEKYFMKY